MQAGNQGATERGQMKPNLIIQLPMPIEVVGRILQAIPEQSAMSASDENGQVRIYFDPADVPEGERIAAWGNWAHDDRACRGCGCTDNDCSGCIERTGEPCHWVEDDLCSACVGDDSTAPTKRQPLPTEGRVDITPLVVADLKRRTAEGVRKYGRPLQSHNGRDPLWDAYEECLDQAQYLRQAIVEREAGSGD